MSGARKAWHSGSYTKRRNAVVAQANADPTTRCWRCNLTLAEHAPHKNGKPAAWTGGHVRRGDPTSPILAEASTCNYTHGAIEGNAMRVQAYDRQW